MTLVVGAWIWCAGVWDLDSAADQQRRKASASYCEYQGVPGQASLRVQECTFDTIVVDIPSGLGKTFTVEALQ